jgi:hypothetical protein
MGTRFLSNKPWEKHVYIGNDFQDKGCVCVRSRGISHTVCKIMCVVEAHRTPMHSDDVNRVTTQFSCSLLVYICPKKARSSVFFIVYPFYFFLFSLNFLFPFIFFQFSIFKIIFRSFCFNFHFLENIYLIFT